MKSIPTHRKPTVVKVGNTAVRIYGTPESGKPRYTVVHYEGGKRLRRTFVNLDQAKREAELVATKLENGQRAVLELMPPDRESYALAMQSVAALGMPLHCVVEEYAKAREILGGASLLAAAKEYARRHGSDVQRKSAAEVVEEYLSAKEREGASIRHRQTLRSHLNRFAGAFHTSLPSITVRGLEEWLTRTKLSGRARNNVRVSLVTLFRWARDRGYLAKNERTEAEMIGRSKARGGEIGIFSPAQLAVLLDGGNDTSGNEIVPTDEVRLYLALGAFTGLRSAELLRLEWSDVQFAKGVIQVGRDKSKTATRRVVTIQPNLQQWLAPFKGRNGMVFISEKASDRTIAYAKALGLEWPNNVLRHSYASYRLAVTHDAARVALEMGNSPQMLFSNYREVATEADGNAWFAIAPGEPSNVLSLRAG